MDLSHRLARLTPEQRAQLAKRLDERRAETAPRRNVFLQRPAAEPPYLSFGQERLWFLEQLEGTSATFNICFANRLRGTLRLDCLERALTEIVRRHESLRTTFPAAAPNQPPVQRIHAPVDFRLEIPDLPAGLSEEAARQMVDALARRPVSLARGPLFQGHLLRLGPDDHVLVLIVHHMVADGWSFEVLARELATLYADFVSGRAPSLPPLVAQYADFAYWQRELLQGLELERVLDYWQNRLAGIPPLLELPADFPRPADQSYRGAICERWIGAGLVQKVNDLTRQTDATLFMTLLAAFTALLHRYSGQTDILVGSPVTSRNRVELEPLIGFFVNMLPFRTDFSGSPTARELIQQVRHTTIEALSHQELPFERLVRELRPVRDLSHAPLFQVALMFQQEEQQLLHLPGLAVEPMAASTATAKFDLSLFASESKQGLHLWLEYSTDLFQPETANRLLAHLECLLDSMVTNPDLRVPQLNLLPPPDRQQILVDWNRTGDEFPTDQTIHALFEKQAARTPAAIAVEYQQQRLTYRELDQRADALAEALRREGVTAETHVGIYVERSSDLVVAVLGILKAGGTYVPLDPAFPRERLTFMVADARIPVLVTQARLVGELPEHRAKVIKIDQLAHAPSGRAPRSPAATAAENLAYTLYTSGSTGRPKGVQISHRSVVNFLHSMGQSPGLKPEDIWLAVTTLSFDIAGLELFLPLITGARVVIAQREDTMDAFRLVKLIKYSGATVMQATPATWRMLIEAGWRGDRRLKVLCGGEAIARDLADHLMDRCGELWNMYGPTETTIWSTMERLLPSQPITIGRPIANTQVYILGENLQPAPPGVIGELFIGGAGVARGYLNRPDLTREKFIPDPFAQGGAGRLYRTGDLARFRTDGRVEFLGRVDHQVKIRGFRIELGEIESALTAVDGVAQALVVVREDTPGDKRLVAYIVSKPNQPAAPDAAALRSALRVSLPDYMIPASFAYLKALPLTPNGKVDREALPPPDQTINQANVYEAPQGPTETKLAEIMARLLRLPRVSRTDGFFELGGHSILAVTFFNEIEHIFGKRIPLATLFRAPTVEHLAAVVDAGRDQPEAWASLVPIQPKGSKPRFFCVHGAGGNVLLYRDLSRSLGTEFPFYGLQAQGLDRQAAPLTTVEEMAERYLTEIRAFQPEGPYCLGGYCLGGTIAYEMAQRLRHDGEQVAFVALFDTYNFTQTKEGHPLRYLWQKIKFHVGNLRGLSWKELPSYLSNKMRTASEGELSSLLKALTASRNRKGAHNKAHSFEAGLNAINDAAAAAYRPKPYPGRVIVFKPKVNYDFFPDPRMGWGDIVTEGLEIAELPVNPHAMLVEPFVEGLARVLGAEIDSVSRPTITR